MTSRNKLSRQVRKKEKAAALFVAYQQMGTERSLSKLYELCFAIGVKVSEKTLQKYSVDFEWQRRLLEFQSKEAEMREKEVSKLVDDMNRQDAAIAGGMKGLVVAGLRFHQDKMKREAEIRKTLSQSDQQLLDMGFSDIANLARTAQTIERLARGQATSRTEVWVDVASTVVREFVLIFEAVNKIDDPALRESEFLRLGDESMTRFYSETTRRQLGNSNLERG